MKNKIKKLTITDLAIIVSLVVLIFIFPITNGYIAAGIDGGLEALKDALSVGITQISVLGVGFIQIPMTIFIVAVGYKIHKHLENREAVKIPKVKSSRVK